MLLASKVSRADDGPGDIAQRSYALKLERRKVEKPWGRDAIPAMFGPTFGRRIGEIWFESPGNADLPLLLKYIFTSEKLSVQVHPNDAQARARGFVRGKTECWYVLQAERGAKLALGVREAVSLAELGRAAKDGSLERLLDWKPVEGGDFFYVPAGTIHSIGPGIALLEFQQNADITYRLYDYGRPRELHVDDAVAVSDASPYSIVNHRRRTVSEEVLVNGPIFTVIRASFPGYLLTSLARRRWIAPLEGSVRSGVDRASAGECLLVGEDEEVELSRDAVVICGIEGSI